MKKQLTLVSLLFLIICGITACKKDSVDGKSLKSRMIGKWKVKKIETTVGSTPTTTYTGVDADYLDFRNNDNDELEVNLAGNRLSGNYAVLINQTFNLNISGEVTFCTVSNVNDNLLEFSGTISKSTGNTSKKYELYR
ncbi:hypothetical protein [Pedobacter sp. MC2016-24]|uniref:hypothetical protein n=1 Tax=Pedobacter sp. MC2016-24 TaxID=2780090 RepID=UPI0018827106|nr:hypothetical protein [Pedobacter sp. MC2016-24]MBE9602622.1 hypothetical protein [Pedobacter sp. MC2016-24]